MTNQNIIRLHQQHRYWLQELDLYQDEVRYFQNSLARTAGVASEEAQERITHLRQELLSILEKLDGFRYQLYAHETLLIQRMELANRTQQTPDEELHTLHTAIEKFSLVFTAVKKSCGEVIREIRNG